MTTQTPSLASTLERIRARKARVGVIGLGYVGLPLAVEFAHAGFDVTGFDVDAIKTDQINAGCYVFQRDVIERIPKGRAVSVEREVFPSLLSDGLKVCGYVDATYWRDMGTPDDFVRGSADLVRGIAPSPALKGHRGEELVHEA